MKGPLAQALTQHQRKEMISFHTPGHKNGGFYQGLHTAYFPDSLLAWDTTEIPGMDHLHHPTSVIRESQEKAAHFFGAEESFYLVNGSTSGIYSMIMAVAKPGEEIIVQRNSHQSVFHGCFLGGVTPRYLMPEVDPETGVILGVTEDKVREALLRWPEAKGVLLTTPNYYGITTKLDPIAKVLREKDMLLMVDEAHGSHFILDHRLPKTALQAGADVVVQSTHKTLPAMTQASMLHLQGRKVDRERLRWMLKIHQSSSPSYLLMASLEATVSVLESQGPSLMEPLLDQIEAFKINLSTMEGLCLGIETSALSSHGFGTDPTRLWINLSGTGLSGYQWDTILAEKYQIRMELADPLGVLGIATIGNEKKDFDRLVHGLKTTSAQCRKEKIDQSVKVESRKASYYTQEPTLRISLEQALQAEKESVELEKAIGRICGESLVPYPPGVPVAMPGEEMTESLVAWLKGRQEFNQSHITVVRG